MLIIVGLGNPGKEYVRTRHNCGFMVVDRLAESYGLSFTTDTKFHAEVAEVNGHKHRPEKVVLVKPQTYMNLSGEAVSAISRFFKVEPKNIWVVADDLDLPLGKIRVRHGGESGGHHGLESIANNLGKNDFSRIRIGIRGEQARQEQLDNNISVNHFVTSPFEARETELVDRTIRHAAEILQEAIQTGELKAHTHEVDGFDSKDGNL